MTHKTFNFDEIIQQLNDDTRNVVKLGYSFWDRIMYVKDKNIYAYTDITGELLELSCANARFHQVSPNTIVVLFNNTDDEITINDNDPLYNIMKTLHQEGWTLPQINDWLLARDFIFK